MMRKDVKCLSYALCAFISFFFHRWKYFQQKLKAEFFQLFSQETFHIESREFSLAA